MDKNFLRKEAILLTTFTTVIGLYKVSRFWEKGSNIERATLIVVLLANLLAWISILTNQKTNEL
jgi:hypothetical protein